MAATLVAAALSGCAAWAPQPTEPGVANAAAWQARQAQLGRLHGWTLRGRAGSGGALGFTGRLRWVQTGEAFVIDVAGPFGAGATRLTGTPNRVEIRNARNTWVTDDPQRLLREVYGWTLPVSGLRHWALGRPIPGVPATPQVDADGRLVALQQSGWTLRYPEYVDTGAGIALPAKVELETDGGDTRLRLLVESWGDLAPGA